MAIPNLLRAVVGAGGKRVSPTNAANIPNLVTSARFHVAVADIIAGLTLLAAVPGFKYRMTGCRAIAIGGSAATVTTVDILATQAAASVKLVAYAQASLTQSTSLSAGASGAAILANGASFQANDVNTAIAIGQTGSNIATATFVDIVFDYVLEV